MGMTRRKVCDQLLGFGLGYASYVLSWHVLSCLRFPCLVHPYLMLPCSLFSFRIIVCLALTWFVFACLLLRCLVYPYLMLPCSSLLGWCLIYYCLVLTLSVTLPLTQTQTQNVHSNRNLTPNSNPTYYDGMKTLLGSKTFGDEDKKILFWLHIPFQPLRYSFYPQDQNI